MRPIVFQGDLFIVFQCTCHDEESVRYYDTPDVEHPQWVVNCRNPLAPHKTALPLGFATQADAERAAAALVAAGLHTTPALHRRIKIEHDWEGVRRIMIEGLGW